MKIALQFDEIFWRLIPQLWDFFLKGKLVETPGIFPSSSYIRRCAHFDLFTLAGNINNNHATVFYSKASKPKRRTKYTFSLYIFWWPFASLKMYFLIKILKKHSQLPRYHVIIKMFCFYYLYMAITKIYWVFYKCQKTSKIVFFQDPHSLALNLYTIIHSFNTVFGRSDPSKF